MGIKLHLDVGVFELDATYTHVLDVITAINRYEAEKADFAWFTLKSGDYLHVRLGEHLRYALTSNAQKGEVP